MNEKFECMYCDRPMWLKNLVHKGQENGIDYRVSSPCYYCFHCQKKYLTDEQVNALTEKVNANTDR